MAEQTSKQLPESVLFVCNHNVIRSPMAAAMTKAFYGRAIYVMSAGVRVGQPDPFVGAVMDELDIDVKTRSPRSLEELEDTWFDLVVTLSPTAHHLALAGEHVDADEIVYWPAADPTVVTGSREQQLAAYRDVRDRIAERIRERFGEPPR